MTKSRKVYIFKVCSSSTMGSGHVYRCLKIAKKLKKSDVFFLSNNFKNNFNYLFKDFNYKILNNSENNFSHVRDLEDTISFLKKIKKEKILIVDNYVNELNWQKKISKFVKKLVVFNDEIKNNYCDLYINENYFIKKPNNKFFLKKNCKKLIGPKFVLINQKRCTSRKNKNNIFIFFGGYDKKKLSIKVIKKLKYFKNLNFYLILNDKKLIKKINLLKIKSIKIFQPKVNFYNIISKCSFGIVSGGSIIWDLIFNSLPFIAIPVAKNQNQNLLNLKKNKQLNIYKNNINNEFLEYFLKCFNKKKVITKLVDGYGLNRVVNQITSL